MANQIIILCASKSTRTKFLACLIKAVKRALILGIKKEHSNLRECKAKLTFMLPSEPISIRYRISMINGRLRGPITLRLLADFRCQNSQRRPLSHRPARFAVIYQSAAFVVERSDFASRIFLDRFRAADLFQISERIYEASTLASFAFQKRLFFGDASQIIGRGSSRSPNLRQPGSFDRFDFGSELFHGIG